MYKLLHEEDLARVKAKPLALGPSVQLGADEGIFTGVALSAGEIVAENTPTLYTRTREPFTTLVWKLTDLAFATGTVDSWHSTGPPELETLKARCSWDADDETQARTLVGAHGVSYERVVVAYTYLCAVNMNTVSGGCGFYDLLAHVNHSCVPNCSVIDAALDGTKHLRALHDIDAGEEITFSYTYAPTPCSTEQRRELLHALYGFVCGCSACLSDQSLPSLGNQPDASLFTSHMPDKPAGSMRMGIHSMKTDQTLIVDVFFDTTKEPHVYAGLKRVPYTAEIKKEVDKVISSEQYRRSFG